MNAEYKQDNKKASQQVEEPFFTYAISSNMNLIHLMSDKYSLIDLIRKGFGYSFFLKIADQLPFTIDEWANLLGLSPKSMQRYKTENRTFKALQSEKIIEIAEVSILGNEVFGNKNKFLKWFIRPSQALGGMSPKELVSDSYGKELVIAELYRIEHGVLA